jgi:hypothetical protein
MLHFLLFFLLKNTLTQATTNVTDNVAEKIKGSFKEVLNQKKNALQAEFRYAFTSFKNNITDQTHDTFKIYSNDTSRIFR